LEYRRWSESVDLFILFTMKHLEIDRTLQGSVTLPAEAGKEKEMLELVGLWKPDAIRDSDGTRLSDEILKLGYPIYSTTCLVRADQAWARAHPDQLARKYLMSDPVTATGSTVEIRLLDGFSADKYAIDTDSTPTQFWEVIDRTNGDTVSPSSWDFDVDSGTLVIRNATAFHRYTVSFLVWVIWDSTSMYNHITNSWTIPPIQGVDPYLKPTWDHLMEYFEAYLDKLPDTEVVRLTTLAYHFVIDSDEMNHDKYRDWHGYGEAVSPEALADFAKQKGYALRPEHFVDQGYYNNSYRVPAKEYRDWMDFVHRFVVEYGRELVRRIHVRGKKAAVFWGDHWAGMEPYSPRFQEIGIDINIGACEDGVALRRLADSPGPQIKEIRLYPYFFPDVFKQGGDPTAESRRNWMKIRRALFRQGIDRIGHGGYLRLALGFPEFIRHVADICDEFRMLKEQAHGTKPAGTGVRVAVLDAWGGLRSWINHMNPDQKFHVIRPDTFEVAGSNALECLSGLPVDVSFLSIDEVLAAGRVPAGIDVLLTEGTEGTAWSGGYLWKNPSLSTAVRAFVHAGGAFVGIGDPSAAEHQGQCFQLGDLLGVQKEKGNSMSVLARPMILTENHFITADLQGCLDVGGDKSWTFLSGRTTQVLAASGNHVHLAVNEFGSGRCAYIAGLPYSAENSRVLLRTILWCARKEEALERWHAANPTLDVGAWPERRVWAVANSVSTLQKSRVFLGTGEAVEVEIPAYAVQFFSMD
jgi:1,3-beta-galactosyl-N-acetylhexosamine phosphorylase